MGDWAWQRVSAAYDRVMLVLGPEPSGADAPGG